MRRLSIFAVAVMVALVPVTAQAQPPAQQQMTVQAAPDVPLPGSTVPLSMTALALAAIVGATDPKGAKTKKVSLSKSYIFGGQTYGPGADIVVPDDFPEIDGETGDVVFPEGSAAARNQERARSFSSAPNTGGVNTGEGQAGSTNTVSGKSAQELESMTKADLVDLAAERNIEVTRSEGEGDPVKQDYIDALSKTV